MDAIDLPAAQEEIRRSIPVLAHAASTAEGQLVDIARDESVLDVEFGESAFCLQIVWILRLAEGSGVEARYLRRWSKCDRAPRSMPCRKYS